ncbi:unnamed protein product [Linum tenue]|uniref:Uncharacterized protein n=1 Tax=Linum tenue TaxID=586396 RepID=A0AAV0PSN9_9ROSI|nr:unnamed protein product [Linum tenue]
MRSLPTLDAVPLQVLS